jgi:hypothetical protein
MNAFFGDLIKKRNFAKSAVLFFSFTDFGRLMPSLEIFHSKSTYFIEIQTFLVDFPLTKHLFLKNSDIFRGFIFNKVQFSPTKCNLV